jgi:glycopeptide antibiotics resistance protein
LSNAEGLIALYPMDEKKGSVIHNLINDRYHLIVPDKFNVLRKDLLQIEWKNFKLKSSTFWDFTINILGFMPLGYLFVTQRVLFGTSETALRLSIGLAILGGTCISLVIEILQTSLPARYSSASDLISNSCGTGIGALLAAIWMKNKKGRRPTNMPA